MNLEELSKMMLKKKSSSVDVAVMKLGSQGVSLPKTTYPTP